MADVDSDAVSTAIDYYLDRLFGGTSQRPGRGPASPNSRLSGITGHARNMRGGEVDWLNRPLLR